MSSGCRDSALASLGCLAIDVIGLFRVAVELAFWTMIWWWLFRFDGDIFKLFGRKAHRDVAVDANADANAPLGEDAKQD